MDENVEFLNYIYQNAHMGVIGIEYIEESISDEELKKIIENQKREYQNFCNEAIKLLTKYQRKEKDITPLAKMGSYMSAKMNLIKDDSPSNLAKMMIEGSNKGIIEITTKLNSYNNADKEIINLANKLLAYEQVNLEELKKFL